MPQVYTGTYSTITDMWWQIGTELRNMTIITTFEILYIHYVYYVKHMVSLYNNLDTWTHDRLSKVQAVLSNIKNGFARD